MEVILVPGLPESARCNHQGPYKEGQKSQRIDVDTFVSRYICTHMYFS